MKRHGFTLIELLVVIAIIGIVTSLIVLAVGRVKESGALAREVSGCRQAMIAYLQAAADRDGELLVGYSASESATDDRGDEVPNPACGRYPWRLAKYLNYKLAGTILVNEQEEIARMKEHPEYVYRASANPSFGINATYVGGNERTGVIPSPATIKRFGRYFAQRLSDVSQPSKLIVFASSRYTSDTPDPRRPDTNHQPGFHLLNPPRTTQLHWWGKFSENDPAQNFGFVHPRYSGRAVCGMLGGNVELLDERELQDMRHWSPQAVDVDDPEFRIKPQK
jgi:prepilin-type N-terminal cleavage/methylation domain-containing protein